MKTTSVESATLWRAWGVLALAVTLIYLVFYCTAAWLYHGAQWRPLPAPNEHVAAYEALAERFVGDRYFHVDHPGVNYGDPEDRYVVPEGVVRAQIERVAQARHFNAEQVKHLNAVVDQLVTASGAKSIRYQKVNVLRLNLALDQMTQE